MPDRSRHSLPDHFSHAYPLGRLYFQKINAALRTPHIQLFIGDFFKEKNIRRTFLFARFTRQTLEVINDKKGCRSIKERQPIR